jgi:S-adenosylmethionine:tRNA ribosyltransferase-isomerase
VSPLPSPTGPAPTGPAPTGPASDPIDLADYAFDLPPDRIAQTPLPERHDARLLRLDRRSGALVEPERDWRVRDLPRLLRPGDLLVVNVTRVLPARLRGRKASGGAAEALLLGPDPAGEAGRYRALVRTNGRLREGLALAFGPAGEALPATVTALHAGGEVTLAFDPGRSPYDVGEPPLPPYIKRSEEDATGPLGALDRDRYQTVFARAPGAVAAPTAGLHLTGRVLEALDRAGVARAEVVLHVGLGTFRPLGADDLARDRLHAERFELPPETAEAIARTRAAGGRVVAVGTTTTRVLESCATPDGGVVPARGETDLFLRPGRPPRVIDGLLTNFHLPGSSLLLLVASLVGREPMLRAYRHAVAAGYRFYSYGDAMLIL